MRKILFLSSLLAAALPSTGTVAATLVHKSMTCPIGGGSFDYVVPASTTAFVSRPDGKPYGTAAPSALPECPANGLVLYKDYDEGEVAKLKPLIASDEYQALRKDAGQYYRAYWLMRKMGVGPEDYLWALLQASWEVDTKPELRSRYLAELAEQSARVPAAPADINWIGMEARSINALRELGRFDEAAARLQKAPLAALGVQIPAGRDIGAQAVEEAKAKRAWLTFFQGLKAAVARRDKRMEPFDLVPRSIALGYCIEPPANPFDSTDQAYCDREKASVDEMRAARARAEADLKAVSGSREQSGR